MTFDTDARPDDQPGDRSPEASPETVVQVPRPRPSEPTGSPRTEVQVPPGTPPEPAGSPRTEVQGVPGASAADGVAFPDALVTEYEPGEIIGRGTEGVVWRVTRRSDGRELAVKVHRREHPVDAELLTHLQDGGFHRHVPEIVAFDAGAGWIAMEFLPVTLEKTFHAERGASGGLPEARVREILTGLNRALAFWIGEIGHIPIDLKPDNVVLRGGSVDECVVCDFGGVVRDSVTQRRGEVTAAPAYTSPEGLIGYRHPASPWWALGEIVYLLLTGRTHFRSDDDVYVISGTVIFAEMDLTAVADERWRHLLLGLFTPNPAHRWTAAEVGRWLAGEMPDVIRRGPGLVRATEPLFFQGDPYDTAEDLAKALLEKSADGAAWIVEHAERLRSWLKELVDAGMVPKFDGRLLEGRLRDDQGPELVLAFGSAYARESTPTYLDRPIDAAGLNALCSGPPGGLRLLQTVISGMELRYAARYACGHDGCGDRCVPLTRVADEAGEILTLAGRFLDVEGRVWLPGGVRALTEEEKYRLHVNVVTLTLGTQTGRDVVRGYAWHAARLFGPYLLPGGRPWGRLLAEAVRAGDRSREGRARLAIAGAVAGRVALASEQDRTRRNGGRGPRERLERHLADRGPVGPAAFAMMLLAVWSGTIVGQVKRNGAELKEFLPGSLSAEAGNALGSAATARALWLFPLAFLLSGLIALLPRRFAPVVPAFALSAFLLGYAAGPAPGIPVGPWEWAREPLSWLDDLYGNWTAVYGCLLLPLLAFGACGFVTGRLAGDGSRPRSPAGPRRGLRRVVPFLLLPAFGGLLWSAAVVGLTMRGEAGAQAGAEAGRIYAELAPLWTGVCSYAFLRALRGKGGRAVPLGALAMVAVGLWPSLFSAFPRLSGSDFVQSSVELGGSYGDATLWWALLLIPVFQAVVLYVESE